MDIDRRILDVTKKKKNYTKKCSDHSKISLISHTGKTIARILSERLKSKKEEIIEEDQFRYHRGKDTGDAIGLMKITSERMLGVKEVIFLCFIHWKKSF